MSVIAFGDLHLDKTEIRLLTVLNFLDYIIDYCKKNPEVKSVINLGDTFHTPQNKNDFFIPIFNKFLELSKIVNIFTIVGNHDTNQKSNDYTLSETFGSFGKFIKNSETLEVPGLGMDDFLSYSESPDEIPNNSNILFCHQSINGFWFNPNKKIEDELFSQECFDKYEQVVSGHLHHMQNKNKFLFVGSPWATNKGEGGKKNYFAVIDERFSIKLEEYNQAPDYMEIKAEDFTKYDSFTNKIVTVKISKKIENFVKLRDILLSKGALEIIPEFVKEEIVEDENEHKIDTNESVLISAANFLKEIKDDKIDNAKLLEKFKNIIKECK